MYFRYKHATCCIADFPAVRLWLLKIFVQDLENEAQILIVISGDIYSLM